MNDNQTPQPHAWLNEKTGQVFPDRGLAAKAESKGETLTPLWTVDQMKEFMYNDV